MRGVDAEQQETYREALAQVFPGCAVLHAELLSGGISSRAMRFTVRLSNGRLRHLVLRSTIWDDLEAGLAAASIQARVLRLASEASIRVPQVWGLYPDPTHVSALFTATPTLVNKRPTLILEYMEGAPCFMEVLPERVITQLASELIKIHRVTTSTDDLTFLPERFRTIEEVLSQAPAVLDASLSEYNVRRVLTSERPKRRNRSVLLHGDYWPGNVLWRDQELSGVIDWEESEWGDPLADVAVARLDLLWAFGGEVMRAFTDAYFAGAGVAREDLPWWDLVAALRPMSRLDVWASAFVDPPISRPDITVQKMRAAHQWFVAEAFSQLGV